MSERPKGTPTWHKVFGVVETVALVACAAGERIGLVTPPPEGTAANPAETVFPPSAETMPTSAAETATATSVEFLEQDAVLATKLTETQTLANLYTVFESDAQVKSLFTDPAGIEYSAMGIKTYIAESGKTIIYPFFSATSEAEKKGYTAMILQPLAEEVSYVVLNRIVDADGKVGLGVTQDLNHQLLEKPVMVFATGLTADQIAKMTDEELSRINLLFVPAGLPVSPQEAPFGVGRYLASFKPVEPTQTPTLEASVTVEDFIRSLEKDGIIFPDRLSSESESGFLRGVYLSEGVMEKTGVEALNISPEKMDKIGKVFLGLLAWTQRNSRPEYQFLQSVQSDQVFGDDFLKLTEESGIKTPVQVTPRDSSENYSVSRIKIYALKFSEGDLLARAYHEFFKGAGGNILYYGEGEGYYSLGSSSPELYSKTWFLLNKDGTLVCFLANRNVDQVYARTQGFETYQGPRDPYETLHDLSISVLKEVGMRMIFKFTEKGSAGGAYGDFGFFERLLGCKLTPGGQGAVRIDCTGVSEEIFDFSK